MAPGAFMPLRLTLRAMVLCAVALTALLVLPRAASAAERVPMCGELGQSIDAPPPLYPGSGDQLAATPCEGKLRMVSASDAAPPLRDSSPAPPAQLKVVLAVPLLLPRVPSTRLEVAEPETRELRPGFARSLDRPPR